MSLLERIDQEMKTALKEKDKEKLSTIRLLKSSIKKVEIDKKRPLTDEEVMDVILREIKQRKDSIAEYEKADRGDLAEKEKKELAVLQAYLPEPLSEEELRKIIKDTIQEVGASSKADMGKVMGAVLPKVKGRAEGRTVSQLVQQELNG